MVAKVQWERGQKGERGLMEGDPVKKNPNPQHHIHMIKKRTEDVTFRGFSRTRGLGKHVVKTAELEHSCESMGGVGIFGANGEEGEGGEDVGQQARVGEGLIGVTQEIINGLSEYGGDKFQKKKGPHQCAPKDDTFHEESATHLGQGNEGNSGGDLGCNVACFDAIAQFPASPVNQNTLHSLPRSPIHSFLLKPFFISDRDW